MSSPNTSQPEEPCLVCQDISSGYHYGVPSCNGCKTFFRRTIMKNQVFICQLDGNCPVDKSIRCACRHCRFEKCLSVGMDRNAIQQNRDPIGYTKRARRYPRIKSSDSSDRDGSPQALKIDDGAETSKCVLEQLLGVEQRANALRLSEFLPIRNLTEAVSEPCFLENDAFMAANAVPSPRHVIRTLRFITQTEYHYWHERDWFVMIEWAKALPVFQKMEFNEKLALLRHSSITYPSLVHIFNSPNYGPDTIVFPDGTYYDRTPEPTRPNGFNKKKYQLLDQLLKPIRRLEIDETEFVAIKAMFFLNPDIDEISPASRKLLCEARIRIMNALYGHIAKKMGVGEKGVDRFGRLLLLGTVVATIAVEMKESVLVAVFFNQIQFSTFAEQLLCGIKEFQVAAN